MRIWAIAKDLGLTEWQVAKQLKRDGVCLAAIVNNGNLKNHG